MLYDFINTEEQLVEFVKKLNDLSHYEKYQLFNYVFPTKLLDLRPKGFKNTKYLMYNKWIIPIGKFQIYSTTRINSKNPIDNPELKTGLYEKIYFHLNIDDQGISQNSQ